MTRYARAKGSKSSNERRPEEPTPWHLMRQQLAEKLCSSGSVENASDILKRVKNSSLNCKEEVWVDFSEESNIGLQENQRKNVEKDKSNCCERNVLSHEGTRKKIVNVAKQLSQRSNKKQKAVKFQNKNEVTDKIKILKKGKKSLTIIKSNQNIFTVEMARNNNIQGNKIVHSKQNDSTNKKKKDIKIDKNIIGYSKESNLIENVESKLKTRPEVKKIKIKERSEKSILSENNSLLESQQFKDSHRLSLNQNTDDKNKKMYNKTNIKIKNCHRSIPNNYHTIIANGREIKVTHFEGFLIKKEDAYQLKKLKKKLKSENVPKDKIKIVMKLERRKAEKSLAREKNKVCFHCRKFGHNLADCPEGKDSEVSRMCFKCGSMEHTHFQCKVIQSQNFRYAVCFICKEQGHIARQCTLNRQGQYPKGGSCHFCGEVNHLRKDCPKAADERSNYSINGEKLNNNLLEDISEGTLPKEKPVPTISKVVKY